MRNFGKVIRICLANRWLDFDPFVNYKSKIKVVDRAYLTVDEIQQIADKQFDNDRLAQVRDIFLFSCFTGLAYIDVKKLTRKDIVTGLDGEKWIATYRQKTGTPSKVPLLPSALKLIDYLR